MLNMIKMELYRFFRFLSTWKILIADVVLAVLSVVLVYTTQDNTSITIYSNAGELLAAQINGGILMILCAIFVVVFVSAEYKDGFIKNIAGQLPYRGMLIFPEVIVIAVACALYFSAYFGCIIAAGGIVFGNSFVAISVFAIIKLLTVQIILHWGFGCLILFFYILTESTMFSMLIGILMAFKVLNILYTLIDRFFNFKIYRYMLDSNIFQLGIETEVSTYARAVLVGIIFVLVETVLSISVIQKKDI